MSGSAENAGVESGLRTGLDARPPGHDSTRLQLEEIIGRLSGPVPQVVAAQDQVRALLRTNGIAVTESSLLTFLRHIVARARDLTQARYAALGVVGGDGFLDRFVHAGMSAEAAEWIGSLPQGRGLLALPISSTDPVRLTDLTAHSSAVGFPPNHPAMRSYLGIPIQSEGQVFGSLYLTESAHGEFTVEDEQVVTELAATAAVAIDRARSHGLG